MRALKTTAVITIFLISTAAFAAEKADAAKFNVTGEMGQIILHDPAAEYLDDALCYGLTFDYHLSPKVWAELPILMSSHEDKDLPEDQDASMSLISITPGLSFGTTGKLRWWMFIGFGASIIDGKSTIGSETAENNEIGFATNMRAGLDARFFKNMLIGVAGGVMTSSAETQKLIGSPDRETFSYYTLNLRVGYEF